MENSDENGQRHHFDFPCFRPHFATKPSGLKDIFGNFKGCNCIFLAKEYISNQIFFKHRKRTCFACN